MASLKSTDSPHENPRKKTAIFPRFHNHLIPDHVLGGSFAMKTKSIRHFTLVELLTVVVIMTILGSITIPLYKRLMTGSAVSYANRLVNSQLNMARVHACKKRKNVAVLFADYSLTYKADVEETDILQFAHRAFRCAYVTKDTTGWKFSDWVEGSKWEFLPRGAFFTFPVPKGKTESNYDENAVHNYTSPKSEEAEKGLYPIIGSGTNEGYSVIDVKDDGGYLADDAKFKFAIIFKPNGRPVEVGTADVSDTPRVRIAEGVVSDVDKTNGITVVKFNKDNYMISTVNRYTGLVSTLAPEI